MKDVPMIAPDHLREIIRTGLLSFPVTPFDDQDRFNPKPFAAHLEWLSSYPVAGLIVAGGTGELFSLTPSEVVEVVKTARSVAGDAPVIAGCGYGTRIACDMAREIEAVARTLERRVALTYGETVAHTAGDDRLAAIGALDAAAVRGLGFGEPARDFPGLD